MKQIRNRRTSPDAAEVHTGLSRRWVKRFIQTHPLFRLRLPTVLHLARIRAYVKPVVELHFHTLDRLIQLHKYSPKYIFNLDETSFLVKHNRREMVITSSSREHVFQSLAPPLFTATCVVITSANGDYLRPRIILPSSRPTHSFRPSLSPLIDYTHTQSGWVTKSVFKELFSIPLEVSWKKSIACEEERVKSSGVFFF